jgi:hypothetical protein
MKVLNGEIISLYVDPDSQDLSAEPRASPAPCFPSFVGPPTPPLPSRKKRETGEEVGMEARLTCARVRV